jgi:hypothetical protein
VIKAAWVRGRGVVGPAAITNQKQKNLETMAGVSPTSPTAMTVGDLGFWFDSASVPFFSLLLEP